MKKLLNLLIVVFLSVTLLVACVMPKFAPLSQTPIPFEQAIRALTNNLLSQVQTDKGELLGMLSKTTIVLDPFVDATSGEVVKVSRRIEELILEEGHKNFSQFALNRVTPDNLRDAEYVISGAINFTIYEVVDATKKDKYYRVSSSVFNKKTGKIIANAKVWLAEKELDYTPVPAYKDSPVYLKDRRIDSLVTTTETPAGQKADREYYESLDTNALLVQADTAYETKNYEKTALLLDIAAKRPEGQLMKTYAGAYEANLKLGKSEKANQMFRKLLELNVKENKKLNLKFLFSVNKMEFIEDDDLRQQYSSWLHQINQFFKDNNYCFHIVGHSSHTGAAEYNKKLSLERAKKVQKLMQADFPQTMQKSRAIGKGFEENLVGSGTDDLRDAIDRRVEFVVIDCSQL
jgi:outer membrane protein OmpA-like peptidoglycan-associated protein